MEQWHSCIELQAGGEGKGRERPVIKEVQRNPVVGDMARVEALSD